MTAKATPRARARGKADTAAPTQVARRLTQLSLGEVSCVDMPANPGARHLMFKGLANAAAIAKSDAAPPQGSDPAAQPTDPAAQGSDPAAAPPSAAPPAPTAPAPRSGDALQAMVAALEATVAERDEQLAFMANELATARGAADPAPQGGQQQQQETDMTQQNAGGAPDGGSADKSAVDKANADLIAKAVEAAVAKATEGLTKRAEAAEKRAEDAEKVATAERDARELTDLSKAAEGPDFRNLPGTPMEKAHALGAIAKLPEKVRGTLEQALKAGNAAMGRTFSEVGKGGDYFATSAPDGATPAEAELDRLAKDAAKVQGVPYHKAYAGVMSSNPDLYARFKSEQNARARSVA